MAIRRISNYVILDWEEDLVFKNWWHGSVPQEGPEAKRTGALIFWVGKRKVRIHCTREEADRYKFPDEGALNTVDCDGKWLVWYRGHWYWDSEDNDNDARRALIEAYEIRKSQSVDRAKSLAATKQQKPSGPKRDSIPADLRVLVWERDGGKCVECNAKEDLQFDHIIPVAMGGGTSEKNLQVLCGRCNRSKGASLG